MDIRYIYLAVLIVVVGVIAIVRSRQVPPYVKQMQREDGDDPLKRWARGCYAVNFGPASPELRGVADCRQALSDSWDINSAEEARATVAELSAVPTGRVAWDLVRLVVCARLAAGAGLISLEEAQAVVGNIQRRLQDPYAGWEEMAADFDAAARERGFGDGRLQLRPAAREIWNVVPFK